MSGKTRREVSDYESGRRCVSRADRESTRWLEGVITFAGRQDNSAVRPAAVMALAFNLLMVVAAIASIMMTVPGGRRQEHMR